MRQATIEEAEYLYFELNKIFSSPHGDGTQEQSQAQEQLRRALVSGITEQQIIDKMKQLVSIHEGSTDYKSKLSVTIANRFWEKSYTKSQPYRRFKAE